MAAVQTDHDLSLKVVDKTKGSMRSIKDKVAQQKGYPSWDEMYDWICREGQRPEVVGQLIEAAMRDYIIAWSKHLQEGSFEGWDLHGDYPAAKAGYITACKTFEKEIA